MWHNDSSMYSYTQPRALCTSQYNHVHTTYVEAHNNNLVKMWFEARYIHEMHFDSTGKGKSYILTQRELTWQYTSTNWWLNAQSVNVIQQLPSCDRSVHTIKLMTCSSFKSTSNGCRQNLATGPCIVYNTCKYTLYEIIFASLPLWQQDKQIVGKGTSLNKSISKSSRRSLETVTNEFTQQQQWMAVSHAIACITRC